MPENRDEPERFGRSYTAAWNSGEPARVAEHYAPDGAIAINGGAPTPILEVAESFRPTSPSWSSAWAT